MLWERYVLQNIFEQIGTVSLEMELVLIRLNELLEEDGLFEAVKADLAQAYRRKLVMGRGSMPVEEALQMLVANPCTAGVTS